MSPWARFTRRCTALAVAVASGWGCRSTSDAPRAHIVVEFETTVPAGSIVLSPSSLASRAKLVGRRLVLDVPLAQHASGVTVQTPDACPVHIDTASLASGQTSYHQAKAWIHLPAPQPEVGPGAPLRVEVIAGCPEARQGRVDWRVVEGTVYDLKTHARGFSLSARMPELEELYGAAVPHGLAPVAPRQQGKVVLEARFALANHVGVQQYSASALSRSRGLPNVPVDASVLLGGEGWQLRDAPPGAHSPLRDRGSHALLRPDVAGHWVLENPSGEQLSLRSAAYDQVALDCTRASCHSELSDHSAGGMSTVMTRGLAGKLGPDYDVECALPCHAVGEPGLADGGFDAVARELRIEPSSLADYHDLPPALQRLSNVGCLGCHGPGAIPEPEARWAILRSDVCAYCHDAPPRYGHVKAWRRSAMSRADANPALAEQPGCGRCHTTHGFLAMVDAAPSSFRAPPTGLRLGIGCVACHDVHQRDPSPSLLRALPAPAVAEHLDATRAPQSRVCLNCHAPLADTQAPGGAPAASAAALWLGRGGFDAQGEELVGPAPHAMAPAGCMSCHIGSGDLGRGGNHDFTASGASCARCHQRTPEPADPHPRALDLLERVARSTPALASLLAERQQAPWHARPVPLDLATVAGRAAYNLLLIAEDPAAGIHNPAYAKLLLDQTEEMLAPSGGARRPVPHE